VNSDTVENHWVAVGVSATEKRTTAEDESRADVSSHEDDFAPSLLNQIDVVLHKKFEVGGYNDVAMCLQQFKQGTLFWRLEDCDFSQRDCAPSCVRVWGAYSLDFDSIWIQTSCRCDNG
jgi:hypothetical protein